MTLLISNEDILRVMEPATCIDALEVAYRDLASGQAVNRPRSHTYTPLGDGHWYILKSMDGSIPRYGVHALRMSSDHVHELTEDGRRRREKLPFASGHRFVGLVMLFDIHSLEPLAILHDGELQRWLVGCTSALAAKHLSRADAHAVAIIGSGWQAETQLLALATVRDLREIRAYSTNTERLRSYCARLSQLLARDVRPVPSSRDAIDGADIVVCATNAHDPVFDGAWIVDGQHVNSVQRHEIDAATLERADVIVVRNTEPATFPHPPGEMPWEAADVAHIDERINRKVVELGDVVSGRCGRSTPEQVTLFPSSLGASSGLGVTFAAVAHVVYQAAKAKGLGKELPTEWFTETAKP